MIKSALDVAIRDALGPNPVRESAGPNRSPAIDAMNQAVGNPLGSPYCAAGVSHCFRAFAVANPDAGGIVFPYSGSSQAILAWFRAHGHSFTEADHLRLCHGALGGWTDPDGEHGHVFFVAKRLTDAQGHVAAIETLEYNTSPATKGREGDGAYALRREIAELRTAHPRFWFIDVSAVRGGQWWRS